MSFDEFLHGLFVAKDIQQSDVATDWEQQHSTPYNHEQQTPNYTSKVRISVWIANYLFTQRRVKGQMDKISLTFSYFEIGPMTKTVITH